MKKLLSFKMLFLYILIIISILTIYKITNHNNIIYLSLGDEYSKGINSYGIKEYSYSDYLKDLLKEKNKLKTYINNFSEDEMTIENLKNNIINDKKIVYSKQIKSLKHSMQDAKLLTLSIGINDLKYKILTNSNYNSSILSKDLSNIKKEFNSLIKLIKKYYKYDIYVIGYPNVSLESYYLSLAIREYNNFLETNKNIIYIPVTELEKNSKIYFDNPNSNYYNRNGHKLISNIIYKKYKNA